MIEAIVGLPGSGKTLWAVHRLIKAKKQGRHALANFHSRTGMWDFGLWADIAEAGNCLAVIDEAHMWFSARNWSKTNQLELSYFQQHRKEGVDLCWIAQHENRVDVAIRELTAFIYRVRKMGRFCWISKTTPDEPRKPLKRSLWLIDQGLFQHYFTEERIGERDGTGYKFGGGAAYATQERGSAALLDTYRLAPNRFRIEFPGGIVRYMDASHAGLGLMVGRALASWTAFGLDKEAESIVTPLYVGPGGIQELTSGGEIIANGVQGNVFEDAKQYVAGWLRELKPKPDLKLIDMSNEPGERRKIGIRIV
jgi:hypothetical protein